MELLPLLPHSRNMTSPASAKKSIGPRELTIMMASLMALNALAIDAMLPAFPAMAQDIFSGSVGTLVSIWTWIWRSVEE